MEKNASALNITGLSEVALCGGRTESFTRFTSRLLTKAGIICLSRYLEMHWACRLELYLDDSAVKDQIIEFKRNDNKGIVIKSITLKPGEAASVDINISGVDKLFIYTRRTTSDKITKLVIGEPTSRND